MKVPTVQLLFLMLNVALFLPSAGSQEVVPYPDNSPNSADFRLMGLRDENLIWKYSDFQKAFKIFDQIYEADKFSLPRINSQYSGKLFDRLVCLENYDYLLDTEYNIGTRVLDFEKWKTIPSRLLLYYIEDNEVEERFGSEVLACYFLDAYLFNIGMSIYEELRLQLGERANLGQFMAGYDKMQTDLNTRIEQIFYLIENDYHRFNHQDLATFANKLYFFLPKIESPTYKKQLKLRIRLLERNIVNIQLKEIFQDIRSAL